MSDDCVEIDWIAIPLAGERVRVDREWFVHRADPLPAEISYFWA